MTSAKREAGSLRSWKLDAGGLQIERVESTGPLARSFHVPVEQKISIIVQLKPFRLHRLWRSRQLVYEGSYKAGGTSITNMEEEWRCHHLSAFDNFRIQISLDHLNEMAARAGAGRGFSLRNPRGHVDATLQRLAGAISPTLDLRQHLNRLYIGHVTNAMMTHVISTYGNSMRRGRYQPILSPRHERLAIEYMRHHVTANISVEDIAAECGISAGHFTKAFYQATGLTPHQWILHARVDMAKALLKQELDIASVATSCGFADQSHLTRVFKKITGASPARWRKNDWE